MAVKNGVVPETFWVLAIESHRSRAVSVGVGVGWKDPWPRDLGLTHNVGESAPPQFLDVSHSQTRALSLPEGKIWRKHPRLHCLPRPPPQGAADCPGQPCPGGWGRAQALRACWSLALS